MKKLVITVLFLLAYAVPASAYTDPSKILITFYSAYLSEKPDCSGPVKIGGNDAGEEFNMLSNPTLASGSVAPKVYQCLIIEMSDQVKFVPAATDGACAAGTTYTLDICRANAGQVKDLAGNLTTCRTAQEDKVFIYISKWSISSQNANSFQPPEGPNDFSRGIPLADLIDVTKGGGTFIFDGRGKVDGIVQDASSCNMDPPIFGFRPT